MLNDVAFIILALINDSTRFLVQHYLYSSMFYYDHSYQDTTICYPDMSMHTYENFYSHYQQRLQLHMLYMDYTISMSHH